MKNKFVIAASTTGKASEALDASTMQPDTPPSLRPNLIYIICFDAPGCGGNRLLAKMLVSSLLRTFFTGDILVFRNFETPLFLVERKGLEEIYVDAPQLMGQPGAEAAWCWKYKVAEMMVVSGYDKVLFLDADFLALRNIDHLLEGDWDIRYQPERGHKGDEITYNTFYTPKELTKAAGRTGINSGSIAVRAEVFHEVMARWREIDEGKRYRNNGFWDQASWNRLLMNHTKEVGHVAPLGKDKKSRKGERDAPPPWVAEPFPDREIQFPMYMDLDFRSYSKAALTHNCGMNALGKIEFTFGLYMRTFFSDPSGLFFSMLEM
jgi:hypothetical protein